MHVSTRVSGYLLTPIPIAPRLYVSFVCRVSIVQYRTGQSQPVRPPAGEGGEREETMTQPQHVTTHNRLRPLDPRRISAIGYHHDGGGLYLQVREGRGGLTRSWVFRYTLHGVARNMGLGPLHTITLAE